MENKDSKGENNDDLDPVAQRIYAVNKLRKRYKELLEPLSLFASHFEEKKYLETQLERPVTPIDKSVKKAPTSLSVFCQIIRRRICVKPEIASVSEEHQQALGGIIMAHVKMLWEDVQSSCYDPFLSATENVELGRRITTHIATVCEQLFLHYLYTFDIVRHRDVFTDHANISRFKAQLSVDCTKFLKVLAIKTRIAGEIKALRRSAKSDDEDFVINIYEKSHLDTSVPSSTKQFENQGKPKHTVSKQQPPYTAPTLKYLYELSRPKSGTQKIHSVANDLKEIKENILYLDLEQLYHVLPQDVELVESTVTDRPMEIAAVQNIAALQEDPQPVVKKIRKPNWISNSMKPQSMPNLLKVDILRSETKIAPVQNPNVPLYIPEFKEEYAGVESSVADELRRMSQMSYQVEDDSDPEAQIPPLIQALTRYRSGYHNKVKNQKMQQMLMELEGEESQEKLKQQTKLQKPEHPQPTIITTSMPKKVIVQTTDVRISDRFYSDCIHLDLFPPLFNEFVGEIEPATVKWLDRNLFSGEELQDVYKALIPNIPTNYLLFDQDLVAIPPATESKLSNYTASSTLTRKKKERIFNPKLQIPITNQSSQIHITSDGEIEDPVFEPKPSKKHAMWLQTWKTTITSNDYLKQLASQESDFLKVIYHLYADDAVDDDDEKKAMMVKQLEEQRQEELKIADILSQKQEFVAGTWNINTVMLGGLGKDPNLKDDWEAQEITPEKIKELERIEKIRVLFGGAPEMKKLSSAEILQQRLEQIWTSLHVPDSERLDMAIKYSSFEYYDQFTKALDIWEQAVKLIQDRECLMVKLETFEKFASDPNRFFEKGSPILTENGAGQSGDALLVATRTPKMYSSEN
eukprot:gi/632978493/ref/XP_007905942.1/ PREDICTED: coiled-coil domain-containing protein 87 isoform X2 [Callorhinchus milii]